MCIGKPQTFTIGGTDITVYPTAPDYYGNPRFIVHYLSFTNLDPDPEYRASGIDEIVAMQERYIENVRHAVGGRRYRGRDFGGGIVFSSYNVRDTLAHALAQTV